MSTLQNLDLKFHGTVISNKTGCEVPVDQWIVFKATDDALLATLRFYLDQCKLLGADPIQLEAVKTLSHRVFLWRREHLQECHVPDAEPGELR
jgi:hypothetical protein